MGEGGAEVVAPPEVRPANLRGPLPEVHAFQWACSHQEIDNLLKFGANPLPPIERENAEGERVTAPVVELKQGLPVIAKVIISFCIGYEPRHHPLRHGVRGGG